MTRTESVAVGFAVGVLCPLFLFIFTWWVAAALTIYHILSIPESGIAIAAFTGLALGIMLDVLFLKKWIPQFYRVDLRLMILVYLCCSVIAVASFMGLPIGNIMLGALAGVYIGRREYHTARSGESISRAFRRGSLFTAGVTGVEAFLIGLLALNEDWLIERLQTATGMETQVTTWIFGIGGIVLLCVVLMIVQFWFTKAMAGIAFGRD